MGAQTVITHALTQGALRPAPGARGYGAMAPGYRPAQGQGVTLRKATDLGGGVVMVKSVEREMHEAAVRVDRALRLPRGHRVGLDRNNLRSLRVAFMIAAGR